MKDSFMTYAEEIQSLSKDELTQRFYKHMKTLDQAELEALAVELQSLVNGDPFETAMTKAINNLRTNGYESKAAQWKSNLDRMKAYRLIPEN